MIRGGQPDPDRRSTLRHDRRDRCPLRGRGVRLSPRVGEFVSIQPATRFLVSTRAEGFLRVELAVLARIVDQIIRYDDYRNEKI